MSLDLICTASFEGCFVDVNPAWKQVLGHDLERTGLHGGGEYIPADRIAEVRQGRGLLAC
jgi:hypothetical protein